MRIIIQGILILTSVLLSPDTTVATQLPLTVSQNGYSGLTVAISNNIVENVALIQKLKVSHVLYHVYANVILLSYTIEKQHTRLI